MSRAEVVERIVRWSLTKMTPLCAIRPDRMPSQTQRQDRLWS